MSELTAAAASTAPPAPAQLTVTADADTELFVIDSRFALVEGGRGKGNLSLTLPPGIYKVKAQAGKTIEESLVTLLPGEKEERAIAPLAIASAAPLLDTQTRSTLASDLPGFFSNEDADWIAWQSGQVHLEKGSGSFLFFCLSGPLDAKNTDWVLTLSTIDNTRIATIEKHAKVATLKNGEVCLVLSVAVNPGMYQLRLRIAPDQFLSETVVASSGWQTCCFFSTRRYDENGFPRADFSSMSLHMQASPQKEPAGFRAGEVERQVELVRTGLENGRSVLARSVEESIIDATFDNPLLGLLGANLMLARPDTFPGAVKLLPGVVTRLRFLLGGNHPDVEALALRAQVASPVSRGTRFEVPPMLRISWAHIVEASATQADLVPVDSLASRIATRLWGSSLYLLWLETTIDQNEADDAVIRQSVAEWRTRQSKLLPAQAPAANRVPIQLGGTETSDTFTAENLPSDAQTQRAMMNPLEVLERDSTEDIARMVKATGIPRARLEKLL